MAEGGVSKEEHGQSVASGSEFVFDFYCELCRDDGLNVEAEGFCVDCKEYLCKPCIHVHRKSRPTRHHDLLDQDSMPKDSPLSHDRVSKDIPTKCKSHTSRHVEFYCRSHDKLGCSVCFATVHKKCAEIESVYEKSDNILGSQLYKNFSKKLKVMEQKSHDMIAKTNENITSTGRKCSEAMSKIRKLRQEFVAIFDELEKTLTAQVQDITSEDKEKMEHLEKELRSLSKAIETIRLEVEDLASSKRVCQLYIQMKERKSELSSLEGNLKRAEGSNDVRMFEFEPNEDTKNILKQTAFGKIVILNRQRRETGTATAEDNRDIRDTKSTNVSDTEIGDTKTKVMDVNDKIYCDIRGKIFMVDFSKMEEYTCKTPNDTVQVFRRDPMKDGSFEPPATWSKMGDKENLKVVTLQPNDKEYLDIARKFTLSTDGRCTITTIERVQNKTLWQKYQAKKKQLKLQNPPTTENERHLWHEAEIEGTDIINANGITRDYCRRFGPDVGDGVYFAVNAMNVRLYYFTSIRCVYYCQVLTGEFTRGQRGMRVPPQKPTVENAALYDSVVDNVKKPGTFVIFNDTQVYPGYRISFRE